MQSEAVRSQGRGWKRNSEESLLSASLSSACQAFVVVCVSAAAAGHLTGAGVVGRVVSLLDPSPYSCSPAGSTVTEQAAEVSLREAHVSQNRNDGSLPAPGGYGSSRSAFLPLFFPFHRSFS